MSAPSPSNVWTVTVRAGPSSSENLTSTLVSWARRRGLDPKFYHLTMESEGKVLIARGFDKAGLFDFLAYARTQSIPPLECSAPRPLESTAPSSPTVSAPPAPAAPAGPAPVPQKLSAAALQMALGAAQMLADRGTEVRLVEGWLTTILASPQLTVPQVILYLRLSTLPDADPVLLALAESETLRREGSELLGVPPDGIPARLAALRAPPAAAPAPPPAPAKKKKGKGTPEAPTVAPEAPLPPVDPAKLDVYSRQLATRAQHWAEVLARLRSALAAPGQRPKGVVEGAVFLDEEDGRVVWVIPHSTSPLIKALAEYAAESQRLLLEEERRRTADGTWASPARQATYAALETARRVTRMALRLGLEFRWVVMLSTFFAAGAEEPFGLPIGHQAPVSTQDGPRAAAGTPVVARFNVDPLDPFRGLVAPHGVALDLVRRREVPAPSGGPDRR